MKGLIVTMVLVMALLFAFTGNVTAQVPDSMYYEVVQTNPPLGTPPTPQDGFCSSNGGALGCDNLQKYRRTDGVVGGDIVGNWLSAGADVAPLLAVFFDSIYADFHSDNTYQVRAVDPNGVSTFFTGTYTVSPSGVGNIYTITLQQNSPAVATVEGIYEINPAPLTDIVPLPENVPESFRLEQNYPNPFNPATTIRFQVPERESVTLRVFNALGQEVATLVHKTLPAGTYTVDFQAENLPGGVYFYRLQAGQHALTRKMVLAK